IFALVSNFLIPDSTQARDIALASAKNLMVVLRESPYANKLDDTLVPVGKLRAKQGGGEELELAIYEFLGDMHIRFVFDGPQTLRVATPQELASLNLGEKEALDLAIANIRLTYGKPAAAPMFKGSAPPLLEGVMEVKGKSPDLDT